MFGTLTYSVPQKVGIVLYGLVAGIVAVGLSSLGLCVLGFIPTILVSMGLMHSSEGQSWMPISGLICGFYLGIPVRAIVFWKVCRSRLRNTK